MLIRVTREQALAMGILHCVHCGWPPNNHFGNGTPGGKCAHVSACPGYKEKCRYPVVKQRRKKKP